MLGSGQSVYQQTGTFLSFLCLSEVKKIINKMFLSMFAIKEFLFAVPENQIGEENPTFSECQTLC